MEKKCMEQRQILSFSPHYYPPKCSESPAEPTYATRMSKICLFCSIHFDSIHGVLFPRIRYAYIPRARYGDGEAQRKASIYSERESVKNGVRTLRCCAALALSTGSNCWNVSLMSTNCSPSQHSIGWRNRSKNKQNWPWRGSSPSVEK